MTTETKTEQINLHDAALAAYHERQRGAEEARSRRRFEAEEEKVRLLENLLYDRLRINIPRGQVSVAWADDYSYDSYALSVTATIDRLTFSAYERSISWDYSTPITDRQTLYLLDRCTQCGERVASVNIKDLADLGAILHDWVPHCTGGCELPDDEPGSDESVNGATTEQRLIEAFRDFVGEVTRYA